MNKILMTALFAGTMLINNGFAEVRNVQFMEFRNVNLEDFSNTGIDARNYNGHVREFIERRIGLLNRAIAGHNFRHENNGGLIHETEKYCVYLAAVDNLYVKLTNYAIQHNL